MWSISERKENDKTMNICYLSILIKLWPSEKLLLYWSFPGLFLEITSSLAFDDHRRVVWSTRANTVWVGHYSLSNIYLFYWLKNLFSLFLKSWSAEICVAMNHIYRPETDLTGVSRNTSNLSSTKWCPPPKDCCGSPGPHHSVNIPSQPHCPAPVYQLVRLLCLSPSEMLNFCNSLEKM